MIIFFFFCLEKYTEKKEQKEKKTKEKTIIKRVCLLIAFYANLNTSKMASE